MALVSAWTGWKGLLIYSGLAGLTPTLEEARWPCQEPWIIVYWLNCPLLYTEGQVACLETIDN